jgi:hypothetical protein
VSLRPEKKVLEITWVRLPNTKKSYHSKVAPVAEAATTVLRLGALTGIGIPSTAISAMVWSLPGTLRRQD